MRIIKSILLGFLAVGLLAGAAQAEIFSTDIWFVASLDSSSGTVSVESDLCMKAFEELTNEGFEYRTSTGLSVGGGKQGQALLFTSSTPDSVTMVCIANREVDGPGGPGKPGRPGGPGGPGGL